MPATASPGYPQVGESEWFPLTEPARLCIVFEDLCRRQEGVVTRQQATAAGLSDGYIKARLRSGRWQRLHQGVYATFAGSVPRSTLLWAALLACGDGAVLSHHTAAELTGLVDEPAPSVHVSIPSARRIRRVPGIVCHISSHTRSACHPTRLPPQTRVEETVIDLTQAARDVESAVGWIVRACARRLTTVDRLRSVMRARKRLRWRPILMAALGEVTAGCHSILELRYRHDVEQRHGLPTGERQVTRIRRGGRWYDDVFYRQYRTVVELDGDRAHPAEARTRDMMRDNAAMAEGLSALRYGATHVFGQPCLVAAQVGQVLARTGGTYGHADAAPPA
jgi:very-short-patch-repair endonuclease